VVPILRNATWRTLAHLIVILREKMLRPDPTAQIAIHRRFYLMFFNENKHSSGNIHILLFVRLDTLCVKALVGWRNSLGSCIKRMRKVKIFAENDSGQMCPSEWKNE
jgi:hypothetical protein